MKKIECFDGEYRWLSNFWLTPVMKSEWVYPSVENAYQAAKYPKEQRSLFINCSPGHAKRLGRHIDLPENWEFEKLAVMRQLLRQKFQPGSYNSVLLANTCDAEIIEGNTWGDKFWGVCDGEGQNELGLMIMDIRSDL